LKLRCEVVLEVQLEFYHLSQDVSIRRVSEKGVFPLAYSVGGNRHQSFEVYELEETVISPLKSMRYSSGIEEEKGSVSLVY